MYYAGLDVHKKTISVMIKDQLGNVQEKTKIKSKKNDIINWAKNAPSPLSVVLEATLFTGWIYDVLIHYVDNITVANPIMLSYISKAKNKNDKIDANKLCDLLRVNMIPETYMLPPKVRQVRELLRYRNWLLAQCTRFKNKINGELMMNGHEFNKKKLHNKGYFQELLDSLETDKNLLEILNMSRNQLELLKQLERRVKRLIYTHPEITERVELLTTIPGVGEITALTWTLEVWEPTRFSNYKKAISYCGLCAGQDQSGEKTKRGPLSKQRNKRLQWVLIEAAKVAVHRIKDPTLVSIYQKTAAKKNNNAATVAVARHLVKWLMAVDKRGTPFVAA
jgi:transposase